jgi:GTP-binding protein LepA
MCSGKTGEGVEELLQAIIERVPPPKKGSKDTRASIFDFQYSDHQGVIVYLRMFDGSIQKGELEFAASGKNLTRLRSELFLRSQNPPTCLRRG